MAVGQNDRSAAQWMLYVVIVFVAHLLHIMHAGLLHVEKTTNQMHFHGEQNASISTCSPWPIAHVSGNI